MKQVASQKPIFIFAGELSGDMHGGRLLQAMRKQKSDLQAVGVAGPDLRALGVEPILRMEDFQVMGFTDVLKSLPRLWKQFNQVRDYILKNSPDVAIFVDSPSFSLRMAKVLRKRGYQGKIVQYICPTVWAWGKHRIQEMEKNFDLLLTIYPFEKAYFADTKLAVEYVGSPILEMIDHHTYDPKWNETLGITEVNHLIALFPGSRTGEILRNLPKQLEAAKLIKRSDPKACFAISSAQDKNLPLIKKLLNESHLKIDQDAFLVPKQFSYELMKACLGAIAKSGTVTLELALHGCPTVVVFELTALNRFIAKYVLGVKLPFYCIVNILGMKSVFPELIESGFTSENVFHQFMKIYEEGTLRDVCVADCKVVRESLKECDCDMSSSEKAAQAIMRL
jgi:lipid-A-disaccharide synthase